MKNFALSIGIGAALKGSFVSAVSTGQEKMKALTGEAARLGKQKIAVDHVKKYRLALSELTAAAGPAGVSNAKLRTKIRDTRKALKLAKSEARDMGVNVRRLAAEEKRLGTALKLTNQSLKHRRALEANKQARDDLQGRVVGAAASVAAVTVPVTAAVNFESVMGDVEKVVDIPTPKGIKEMGVDILKLTTKIPVVAKGAGAIVAAAGQAGIAKGKKELLGFTVDAAKMGVAFDMAGMESGKMMADWRSGMDLTQAKAVGLADAVNHLSNNMNAQARDLGQVIQRQGAVAMSAGLTETQVASLGAALLSGGSGPEIAATAMKNLTGALTKGKAATKSQREAFDALGFDAEEMATRMQENAPEAIKSVFQALKDAPIEEQSALISQLFGEESKGAIAPLLKNLGNLKKSFDLTSDAVKYTGSMQKEYDIRSKKTANNLLLFKNRVSRLSIGFGNALLPAVNAVLTPLGGILDLAAAGAENFPVLTSVVMGAAAGTAILTAATVTGAYAYSFGKDAILKVKIAHTALKNTTIGSAIAQRISTVATNASSGAFRVAETRVIALSVAQKATAVATHLLSAAQMGLGTAVGVALGPVGVAIAAITAGAVLIYKYWKPIKAFFVGFASGVKSALAPVASFFHPILTIISPMTGAIGRIFGAIKQWGVAIVSPLGSITSMIKGLFNQSDAGVVGAANLGERIGAGLINGVKFVVMNFTPLGWIIKGFSTAKKFLGTVDWSGSGAAIVGTLTAGIKSVAMKPFETVKGMFGKVRRLMASSDAKEGPLSDLTRSGRATVQTLAVGMSSAQGDLQRRVKGVAGTVRDGLPSLTLPSGRGSGQERIAINFNPQISVSGHGDQGGDVTAALQVSEQRLRRMMEDILNRQRRVSYA